MCPLGGFCCVCGVLGHLAPGHRCARSVLCFACAVCWATWLLFTGVPARCVVLRVRCPGPLGSCSPVCPLAALLCVCGVLGHLAPVHPCARSVHCFACAVSWATWHLFSGAPAQCVALLVPCPGPLGSCSPVCPLGVLCCVCGVLGHLAPVHRCARSVCCVACAVSWAAWLLFTIVPAWFVVLQLRYPGPLGCCSPVLPPDALLCCCGVLGHLAPVHRCSRSMCCVACAMSWATWLLFTGVRRVACALSWAPWLLFTGVPAWCVVLRLPCPRPPGYCSPVCPLRPLLCWCGVMGHLTPVHRCVRSVCCVVCAVSWATWLLFTGLPAPSCVLLVRCPGPLGSCSPVSVVLRVPSPGPLGSCSPVCPLCVLCCVSGSWATWLLFTSVPAPSVAVLVRCHEPLGSC